VRVSLQDISSISELFDYNSKPKNKVSMPGLSTDIVVHSDKSLRTEGSLALTANPNSQPKI
jgi:hypothetical protein